MATNDEIVELAGKHSQSEIYSQDQNGNIPPSKELYYTDLDDANYDQVELFLNKDEATIKGQYYLKNRLPTDIIELYIMRYDPEPITVYYPDEGGDYWQVSDKVYAKIEEGTNRLLLSTRYRKVEEHRRLQRIRFLKNPTHKQMRDFLEKVDYIRLYRPRNTIKWYTISPEQFKERVTIIQSFWGLPNLPSSVGDYKYSKRSGRWLTTTDITKFESWEDWGLVESYLINPEDWMPVTAEHTLTWWEKFLRFLLNLLQRVGDFFKKIFGGLFKWLKSGGERIKTFIDNLINRIKTSFKNGISIGDINIPKTEINSSSSKLPSYIDNSQNAQHVWAQALLGNVLEVDGIDEEKGPYIKVDSESENGTLIENYIVDGIFPGTILHCEDGYYLCGPNKTYQQISEESDIQENNYFQIGILEQLIKEAQQETYDGIIRALKKNNFFKTGVLFKTNYTTLKEFTDDLSQNLGAKIKEALDVNGDEKVTFEDGVDWIKELTKKAKADVAEAYKALTKALGIEGLGEKSLAEYIDKNIANLVKNTQTLLNTLNSNTRRWITKVIEFLKSLLGLDTNANLSFTAFLNNAPINDPTIPEDDSQATSS